MTRIETVMFCLSYALGRIPSVSEIRMAKHELLGVKQDSINMVIKSSRFFFQCMSDHEISIFEEQLCSCLLSAVNYRVSLTVTGCDKRGYALCPRCGKSLDRDFQAYCDRCGQHLSWH